MNIVEFIPTGHANAINGKELAELTGQTVREIRREVSYARQDNVILNLQDGKGYFLPDETENELVVDWLKQEESRLKRHALSLRAGRARVKELAL